MEGSDLLVIDDGGFRVDVNDEAHVLFHRGDENGVAGSESLESGGLRNEGIGDRDVEAAEIHPESVARGGGYASVDVDVLLGVGETEIPYAYVASADRYLIRNYIPGIAVEVYSRRNYLGLDAKGIAFIAGKVSGEVEFALVLRLGSVVKGYHRSHVIV